MQPMTRLGSLDRHALVTALWLSFGLAAVALFDHGFGPGGAWSLGAGFATVIAAFVGHVIVNAVYGTGFTRGELALGLVGFGAALVAFVLALLVAPDFAVADALVVGIGFIAVFVAVVFYMVTHYGVRRVFDAFDVIRDFRPTDRDGGSG